MCIFLGTYPATRYEAYISSRGHQPPQKESNLPTARRERSSRRAPNLILYKNQLKKFEQHQPITTCYGVFYFLN